MIMKQKRLILLIAAFGMVWLLIPGKSSCAETALSLQQCLNHGLESNLELQAAQMAVHEAEAGIHEARGSFFPTLRADYSHKLLDNQGTLENNPDYLSQKSDLFSVTLSQPLYTGGINTGGLEKAGLSLENTQAKLHFAELKLVRDISSNFYDLLLAQAVSDKWTESIDRLEQQQDIAQAWVDQDLATRLRLLEIGVELANAHQQLASAQAKERTASAELRHLMAMEMGEQLKIRGQSQEPAPAACNSLPDCLEVAKANRPELRVVELDIAIARQDMKVIQGRSLPQASLDASWVDESRDYDDSALDSTDREYCTLALNLTFKPFQGGKAIAARQRQGFVVKRLQTLKARQLDLIKTEVDIRLEQYKEAQTQVVSAVSGLNAAREAYQFADQTVRLEVSSLDDLLTAELRLTRAEINWIQALNNQNQSRIELDHAIGFFP